MKKRVYPEWINVLFLIGGLCCDVPIIFPVPGFTYPYILLVQLYRLSIASNKCCRKNIIHLTMAPDNGNEAVAIAS